METSNQICAAIARATYNGESDKLPELRRKLEVAKARTAVERAERKVINLRAKLAELETAVSR